MPDRCIATRLHIARGPLLSDGSSGPRIASPADPAVAFGERLVSASCRNILDILLDAADSGSYRDWERSQERSQGHPGEGERCIAQKGH